MTRCPSCPGPHCRQVTDVGPWPAPVLLCGIGPGRREDQTLIPYSGQAGEELDATYLPLAHLPRSAVHIANCTLCYDGDRVPDKRVLDCARHHLPRVLDRVKPQVIVLMGGPPQKICDTRIRLDMHRGRPIWTSVLNGTWEGWVWPSFEPALGMRETGRMTQLLEDFRHLGEWLEGEWAPPQPTQSEKDYKLLTSARQVDEYMMREFSAAVRIAIDTESHGPEPWSIQFSHTPHTGRMIRTFSKDAMECFAKHLHDCDTEGIMHFAVHDLDELDRMGVRLSSFRDTLQEAFHQCNLPQGLKPLAYRLLGVTMRSWEDVVWPASVNAIMRWMEDAIALAAENLTDVSLEQMTMGTCRECGKRTKKAACPGCGSDRINRTKRIERPSAVQGILTHILSHTAKTMEEDEPYNPWKKLEEMKAEGLRGKKAESWEWEYLDEALGVAPILGIGNCDLQEAVDYGCSDACHTLMVAAELERLRDNSKWQVDREDWDQ